MAQDGEIRINSTIDTEGIDKGTAEIESKLTTSATKIKGLNKATAGAVAAVAVKATKEILKGVREVTEAYKIQSKAEKALETAAKNNPYLNKEAVKNLKAFASELQAVSNYGDEFTLGFMTQLAAAGRTQDEIQRIIKASADIAASGAMSFDSAVRNLNKTFSGLAGELGESVPAIRELTQEELKQGKAIEVLQKQYAGMAESVADVRIQMQNAAGDLKEAVGELTAPAANAWDAFWLGFLNKGIEVINELNDRLDKMTFNRDIVPEVEEVALSGQSNTLTDEALKGTLEYYEEIKAKSKNITDEQKAQMRLRLSEKQLAGYILTDEQELVYRMLKHENEKREEIKKKQEEQAKAAEKQAEAQAAINEQLTKEELRNQTAAGIKTQNTASLEAQLKALELKAALTGENVDEQEKLNIMESAYIDLIANSNGLITENNELAIERRKQIEAQREAAAKYNEQEKQEGIVAGLGVREDTITRFENEQAELKASRDYWQALEIDDEQKKADALAKIDEQIAQNNKDFTDQMANDIADYMSRLTGIIGDAAALMSKSNELQMQNSIAALEEEKAKGTLTEEQYEKKKTDIKKKAAKEQYKIDLFNWSASLVTAIANIATGVTKSFAAGWPIGVINGALLSAAGGVQIASIIANKPHAPAFAKGGIVPGNSYAGDNITARVNSGEMVLTQTQQKALFNIANGKQNAAGPQIVINNNASNMVDASATMDRGQIAIMIDAHINDRMRAGKYNSSLAIAQQGQQGKFYGL